MTQDKLKELRQEIVDILNDDLQSKNPKYAITSNLVVCIMQEFDKAHNKIVDALKKQSQQGKDEAIEIIKDLEQHHKELGGEINFKFLIKQIKGEKR